MIDLFSLGLSHGLMLLAAWRLLSRADLDTEGGEPGFGFRLSLRKGRSRDA
jgi:hypothetical protein